MSECTSASRRVREHRHLDAGFFLTVYLVLLFGIQSQWVIRPLGGAGSPALVAGILGFGWWAFYQAQRPVNTGRGHQVVRMALFGLAAAFTASFVIAMRRPIAAEEVSTAQLGMVSLISWMGVTLLASDGMPDDERFDEVLDRLVLAAAFLAALGLAQFVTHQELLAAWHLPGLSQNISTGGLAIRDGFTRPAGTAIHPIEYGAVLTMILPLAVTRAKFASMRGDHRRWLIVAVMSLGIVISISRSALLCCFVGLAILGYVWTPKARRLLLSGALLLAVFVAFTIPGMLGTIKSLFAGAGQDNSISSRTGSYEIAYQFFGRSPLFGRGFSTFLPRYRIFDNQYLLFVIEVGLVGLLAFLTLIGAGIWSARRARLLSVDPESREIGQALLAAVCTGALGLAFFDGLSFPMSTGVLFLVLGLCGSYWRLTKEDRAAERVAVLVHEPLGD